jgi:hypothetical protein
MKTVSTKPVESRIKSILVIILYGFGLTVLDGGVKLLVGFKSEPNIMIVTLKKSAFGLADMF